MRDVLRFDISVISTNPVFPGFNTSVPDVVSSALSIVLYDKDGLTDGPDVVIHPQTKIRLMTIIVAIVDFILITPLSFRD